MGATDSEHLRYFKLTIHEDCDDRDTAATDRVSWSEAKVKLRTEILIRALSAKRRAEAMKKLRDGENLFEDWDRAIGVIRAMSCGDRLICRVETVVSDVGAGRSASFLAGEAAPGNAKAVKDGRGAEQNTKGDIDELTRQMGTLRLDLNRLLATAALAGEASIRPLMA
ncbi:MAG: hypothetical protein BJ554DRAFT_3806 [Olpidium bornovanus]|uniref:Uncharacterized protein n=1 Tax=Olpidium bornovanus TaxID=278681 RepID=A0A8H7ZNW8_9FUNG|nr:MAG: hypothetical protein BJ554DRAFT_3806 [Olpidium bornovanus]